MALQSTDIFLVNRGGTSYQMAFSGLRVPNSLTAGSYLSGGSFDGSTAVTFDIQASSSNTADTVVVRNQNGAFAMGALTVEDTMRCNQAATFLDTINLGTDASSPLIIMSGTSSTTSSIIVDNGTLQARLGLFNTASAVLLNDDGITTSAPMVNLNSQGFLQILNRSNISSDCVIGGNNAFSQVVGLEITGYPFETSGQAIQASTSLRVTDAAGANVASIGPNNFMMTRADASAMLYLDQSTKGAIITTGAGGSKYWKFDISGDGIALSGNWINGSDSREKSNIASLITSSTPANNFTNKIKNLRPVSFKRLGRESEDGEMGFIAQEVAVEFPLAVKEYTRQLKYPQQIAAGETAVTETRFGLNSTGVVAALTAAMQELITRVEALEAG